MIAGKEGGKAKPLKASLNTLHFFDCQLLVFQPTVTTKLSSYYHCAALSFLYMQKPKATKDYDEDDKEFLKKKKVKTDWNF
jgi:Translation machinery associated TMA7